MGALSAVNQRLQQPQPQQLQPTPVPPVRKAAGGLAKSMSNPAWLKAALASKYMRGTPQEAKTAEEFLRRVQSLEQKAPIDPETAHILRRNVERLRSPQEEAILEQLKLPLPEYAKGGLANFRPLKRDAGKKLTADRDVSVMDDPENLAPRVTEREEPLGAIDVLDVLPWGPGTVGRMLGGLSALTASNPAEAAAVKKMLMGVYRGFSGKNATPQQYYHGGTYVPGEKVTSPLYLTKDKDLAESYVWAKGGDLKRVIPEPRNTAPQSLLDELAKEYVPDNAYYGYTPASALDASLHGDKSVGRLMYELGRTPRNYDSVRAFDVGFGGPGATPEGEALVMLPGSSVKPSSGLKVFASPQRAVAERYAAKRAKQTGETPHVEMLMVDPFAGRKYGHAVAGTGANPPIPTMARELSLDDIVDQFQLYRRGGLAKYKECSCGR